MRHDYTDWLIHFVRDRDFDQDYPVETEEEFDFLVGGELEPDASAFSVLLSILNIGLKPYYSFRNGQTTIYGGTPAICVTEMPIYSFAQYISARRDTKKVSAYGIAILKKEFFKAGGRPVIYGTTDLNVSFEVNTPTYRVLDQSILNKSEQYRYVAYNPSGNNIKDRWIDWSHEREWRWRENNNKDAQIYYRNSDYSMAESPGLPLFVGESNGGFFSKVAIIVWSSEEADKIREELTGYYLAESNNYGIEFNRDVIARSVIIVLEQVKEAVEISKLVDSQTIEGLDKANLLEPILLHKDLELYRKVVETALELAAQEGLKASIEYNAENHPQGPCGFAHVSTFDVTKPEVQFMLANDYASGPFDGQVNIIFKTLWGHSQCLYYKEFIIERMCISLNNSFSDIKFYKTSRLD
ncbi:hypothetical protein [Rahnella inusitata]|uniref:DUF2971 domain-containing protein n=1 Tax=Rahnella inusitata TaxID=58169 RepID=A0ABX9P4X2_9GAMM|nr:hypothetical protein [Rahnella inusitata]RJT16066.1 hypothetical protein D5396_02840 [Rahnella inusitata]